MPVPRLLRLWRSSKGAPSGSPAFYGKTLTAIISGPTTISAEISAVGVKNVEG